MDWATRRVLSWRLSNILDARFCTDALADALERYGHPEIFNTDQGSQFTSQEFTSVLNESGVAISMDGRGRCMDNIFIRAPVAFSQVRARLPARALRRLPGPEGDFPVGGVLQFTPPSISLGGSHPCRGL